MDEPQSSSTLSNKDMAFLKERKLAESKRMEALIIDDISFGVENFKVSVYNDENFQVIDETFKYTTVCRRRKKHVGKEEFCKCRPGECNTKACSCWANSSIRLKNRIVTNVQDIVENPMDRILIECREGCGCRKECDNWMTFEKLQTRLEIDYFQGKGFGIRIKDYVSKGQFLCEYVGEVIEDEERSNVIYQFAILEGLDRRHISFIDAKIYGNISRFLNHSCNPNSTPFLFVRSDKNSRRFPQLGFIFKQDLAAGNEVTINYGKDYWTNPLCNYDCNCGTYECVKPSAETTYRTKSANDRVRKCEIREAELNSFLLKEAKLCEKRLKLCEEGKTMEEVMVMIPALKRRKKQPKPPYTEYDRCTSPLMMPEIIELDSD